VGAKRTRMELLRKPVAGVVVPSTATINRILTRQHLVVPRPRKRPRDSYVRWERPAPMQLWGMDIVGGVMLVNPVTGELREAKVVTAVDDHSRFCVSARVVEHATSRAVCLAFAEALVRVGVPQEVPTLTVSSSPTGSARAVRCCSTRSAARMRSPTGSQRRPLRTRTGAASESISPLLTAALVVP
jgi:hypothetical protein